MKTRKLRKNNIFRITMKRYKLLKREKLGHILQDKTCLYAKILRKHKYTAIEQQLRKSHIYWEYAFPFWLKKKKRFDKISVISREVL